MQAFEQTVNATRNALKSGDTKAAMALLDKAWALVGESKALRTIAHNLGNEIQRAIFEQYELAA